MAIAAIPLSYPLVRVGVGPFGFEAEVAVRDGLVCVLPNRSGEAKLDADGVDELVDALRWARGELLRAGGSGT